MGNQKENKMDNIYKVKHLKSDKEFTVTVPGSKSVTNRALMLAALSGGECLLGGVLFSDDTRAFLDCLGKLGFDLTVDEPNQFVKIKGLGGYIPNRNAAINVRSAGTAARFLTVLLALAGGDYLLESSVQMKKRPMEPLLTMLREAGIGIECLEHDGHFPFKIHSEGLKVNELTIDTEVSSQFASALLMAGSLVEDGLKINLTGSRIEGSYIKITIKMLEQFGFAFDKDNSSYFIHEQTVASPKKYVIEPDISAACYFWAMAAVHNRKFTVRRVRLDGMQGDLKFLNVLEQMGCTVGENEEGVWVCGTENLNGVTIDMKDFSDQTMTLAAIAPFASSDTEIKNIAHIRKQESDRLMAVVNELSRMGISCKATRSEDGQEGLYIIPGEIKPAVVETYDDHRVAMAFSIPGTKCDGIRIVNPGCCKKTFENYFQILDGLTE